MRRALHLEPSLARRQMPAGPRRSGQRAAGGFRAEQCGEFVVREFDRGVAMLRKRIFVVEDQGAIREGIVESLNLEADLTVCGEADDVIPALAAIQTVHPDLVLTDIQLRSSLGIELIRELRRIYPTMPLVAMTMFDPVGHERQARAAGATGFAVKQDGAEKLIEAIRAALDQ